MNQHLTIPQAKDDVLSTLKSDGSRRWLFPRLSKGRFWSARRAIAYFLIALYTVIPFLHINGKPVILLDLNSRHFTLLGITFLPTDTALLALFMLTAIISVFLITALLGRIWCGWACPQTVYMEYLFRPIERLFTGRSGRGGKPADNIAGWRKPLMYAVYFALCLHLANTFLAYFVPAATLHHWITSSPAAHPAGFTIVLVITALMMFNFAWFREQTCIIACPYGRLQSVLLDKHSLAITYDSKRGEPRGKKVASYELRVADEELRVSSCEVRAGDAADADNKQRISLPVLNRTASSELATHNSQPATPPATRNSQLATSAGDCVDCSLCVQVCPTGIDIRDGLQFECVACAQCIDACDAVMDKIDRPRGLIGYSSESARAGEPRRIFRARPIIYSTIMLILSGALTYLLLTRSPADVAILRNIGRPFVVNPDGYVENTLRLKITNRTEKPQEYRISAVNSPDVRTLTESPTVRAAPGESVTEPLRVLAPARRFLLGHLDITLRVSGNDSFQTDQTCRLLGPANYTPTTATAPTTAPALAAPNRSTP